MNHPNTLDPSQTALIVIDMQEAFRPACPDFAAVQRRIALLARAAGMIGIPILATEQYRKGLGETVAAVREALPKEIDIIDKTAFSCCGATAFVDRLEKLSVEQVLLCGLEAHICVNLTAHDLLARGYQVHVAVDAITARSADRREVGLAKMQQSGVIPSNVEMAIYELMRDAKHACFKPIVSMIKAESAQET